MIKTLTARLLATALLALAGAPLTFVPFARADDAQLAADNVNFPGVRCVLRARDGQTSFRQGETIRLIASFSSDRPGYKLNRFVQQNRGMARLGGVRVTPSAGVADPLGELPPPDFMAVSGYVPDPITLGEKPVEIPFVLNDWARFDQLGVYQVTLTTARVFASTAKNERGSIFLSDSGPQITSDALQIEITAPDVAWANEQVQQWRDYWRKTADSPRNDISFIGTRAAMSAIIGHLGQNKTPRSSEDDSYLFHTGLIGFPDRAWLVGEMKRAISQPDYAVTQGFLRVLVELEGLQQGPPPAGADASFVRSIKNDAGKWVSGTPTPAQQLQIDWQKRRAAAEQAARLRDWRQAANSTPAKTAAARALTLHTLLEVAWNNAQEEPQMRAQLPQLIAQLAPIFDQLPPLPRYYLLGDEWSRIKSPAFLPALERLRQTPAAKSDYYADETADLTLQRIAELDPKRGRALIVAQIKTPKSSVGFEALRGLPAATLPALDGTLVANFENATGDDIALKANLIWRYTSAAALPRLKTIYENSSENRGYDYQPALLAYFVRVNPGYGIPKIAALLRTYRQRQESDLLFKVASLQPGPQLEQLALSSLDNAGEGVAIDAAKTLARTGSPAAQNALMARLRNTADVPYPKVRARIEYQLVNALANAQNWLCPPAQLREIRELCRSDDARRAVDEFIRARTDGEPLVVDYSTGTWQNWRVDDYSGRELSDLRAKLKQFPRGSEFFWQSTGASGPDATQAFEATKVWANANGLRIRPYNGINARRKELGLI